MSRYKRLIQRARKSTILMDGATGTEAERRGIPQLKNAWNGGAALLKPDILREIHEDYIRCGAEIIISNTFANSKHALEDAGEVHNFISYNEAGVQIAIEARDNLSKNDVLVAGGISYWTWTGRKPTLSQLQESIEEQANVMASSGADFLILEMMIDIEQMLVTLEAAKTAGLPIWVGLTCEPNKNNTLCLEGGDLLVDAIDVLLQENIDAIHIMHTEVEHVLPSLKVLKNSWDGLIGVYPSSSTYANSVNLTSTEWAFENVIVAKSFIKHAKKWHDFGVNFIGGCCGINVDHIKKLSKILNI